MTELLLIRHGRPVSGEADPGLSGAGRRQAERLGQWLAGEQIDIVASSPMARARETAEIASEAMGRTVAALLDDFREWDLDHAADGTYIALEELGDGDLRFQALRTGRYEDFIPAIDRAALLRRARRGVQDVIARWPGQRVAVFTHGGLLNAALSTVMGLEDQLFFFLPEYTSISTIRVMPGGRAVVHSLNSAGHLVGRRDPDTTDRTFAPDLGTVG